LHVDLDNSVDEPGGGPSVEHFGRLFAHRYRDIRYR